MRGEEGSEEGVEGGEEGVEAEEARRTPPPKHSPASDSHQD